MRPRNIVGVAVAAGLITATGLIIAEGGGQHRDDRVVGSSTGTASAQKTPGPKGTKGTSNRSTNGDASEVIREPEGTANNGLPGLTKTKPPTSKGSLLTGALPPSASTVGSIAAGFPVSVVSLPAGAVVRSSGVSTTKTTMQISMVATSPKRPTAVLAFYRRELAAHGFAEAKVPAAGGSTAASFSRGADNLVVTTTGGAKNTTYSLFGTLHAGA